MNAKTATGVVRFGVFEVDFRARQLRKRGRAVRIQEKPFDVLTLLLANAGNIVAREELKRHLWSSDTFVVFDAGLNTAVRKVRDALGDSASTPHYVETIPRHGYRFIGHLDTAEALPIERTDAGASVRARFGTHWSFVAAVAVAVVLVGGGIGMPRDTSAVRADAMASPIVLAVMPFANLSANPREDYLSSGVTEELIGLLAHLGTDRLSVVDGTPGVRRRPGAGLAGPARATHAIEGSLRREAGRVRVTARLIRTADGVNLWADTVERDFHDAVDMQRATARHIVAGLRSALLPRATRDDATDDPANEKLLQGRYYVSRHVPAEVRKGVEYFREAINRRPAFALAHAALAEATVILALLAPPAEDSRPAARDARAAALRAIELDPSLAEAHVALALTAFVFDWNWDDAERHFRRALQRDSTHSPAHHYYARLLAAMGRHDEAIDHITVARRLDPASLMINADAGYLLYLARKPEAAARQIAWTLEMDPSFAPARRYRDLLGAVPLAEPFDDEIAALERAFEVRAPAVLDLDAMPRFDPLRSNPRFSALLQRLRLHD